MEQKGREECIYTRVRGMRDIVRKTFQANPEAILHNGVICEVPKPRSEVTVDDLTARGGQTHHQPSSEFCSLCSESSVERARALPSTLRGGEMERCGETGCERSQGSYNYQLTTPTHQLTTPTS